MRRFLLLFALLSAPCAHAAVDLFQTRVPVADQSEPARAVAVRDALAAVLVRVTGDARVAESSDARTLIQKAATYLQGSSYEQKNESLLLRTTFDGQALAAALQAAGLPMWSANRPTHLLWIGVDGAEPRILDAGDSEMLAPLREAAEARGIPLTLPRGDAADLDAVKPADVFVGEADGLLKASRRYATDQIVTVWASSSGPRWSANWSLLSAKGVTQQWQSGGDSAETALASGLQTLADFEARQFAIRGTSAAVAQTAVEVEGIRSLADYALVLNYLKQLNRTKNVQTSSVQATRVVFQLRIEGSETELVRALAAGSVLREAAATERGALGFSLVR
ncbi:MAG: DUF2066 domain-containing protein [Pseudomonadota bacterium]